MWMLHLLLPTRGMTNFPTIRRIAYPEPMLSLAFFPHGTVECGEEGVIPDH